MVLLKTNTGIGTTNPTSATVHVIGDVLVTGVVTTALLLTEILTRVSLQSPQRLSLT
jgi:hypothetical protein